MPFWSISLWQDARLALRLAARAPAFSLAVVLTLAFGIGTATTVFSLVDAVVLRPLPYRDAGRLVFFFDSNPGRDVARERISPVNFLDYRALAHVFADAAAWWTPEVNLTDEGLEPEPVRAVEASSNFFDVLGVAPLIGPGFPPEPLHAGVSEVVISHRLWSGRYRGDPGIVGRAIRLGGRAFTVVGVMPPGFAFPDRTDLWQRLSWDLSQHNRGAHFMDAVARLPPGVALDRARDEAAAVSKRLAAEFPGTNQGWTMQVVALEDEVVGAVRPALLALLATVGALLLVACLNVAGLLLVRGVARSKEMAVRLSLGADAWRIARQLLVESLLLGLLSVAAGLLVAVLAVRALTSAMPVDLPRIAEAAIDGRVFLFTALVALTSALVFGTGPAWMAARTPPEAVVRDETRGTTQSRKSRWLRRTFVAAQMALAVVVLTGAVLLLRTVATLSADDPGFSSRGGVTAVLRLDGRTYPSWTEVLRFHESLAERLAAHTEVSAAGVANFLPFEPGWRMPFAVAGDQGTREADLPEVQYHSVSVGYLEALGVPLVRGRFLSARDTADRPGVALINVALARRFFGGRDPIRPTGRLVRAEHRPARHRARRHARVRDRGHRGRRAEHAEPAAGRTGHLHLVHAVSVPQREAGRAGTRGTRRAREPDSRRGPAARSQPARGRHRHARRARVGHLRAGAPAGVADRGVLGDVAGTRRRRALRSAGLRRGPAPPGNRHQAGARRPARHHRAAHRRGSPGHRGRRPAHGLARRLDGGAWSGGLLVRRGPWRRRYSPDGGRCAGGGRGRRQSRTDRAGPPDQSGRKPARRVSRR
jgi:putative ABC transport system permease protein